MDELKKDELTDADVFFGIMQKQRIGLTYDDVLVLSAYSRLLPGAEDADKMVSLVTRFSRHVPLTIPFVSAAMHTVTECDMAIAMAVAGGIGVIHCRMLPEEQARQVARVKFHLNGRLDEPKCIKDSNFTIEHVLRWREEKGYRFHTFPVLDEDGLIAGLLTSSDFKFCDSPARKVRDIMTPRNRLVTAPSSTTKEGALAIMRLHKKSVLPLVTHEGKLAALFVFSDIVRILGIMEGREFHNTDGNDQLRVAAAVGIGSAAIERAEHLVAKRVDALVIDASRGNTENVVETTRELKRRFPDTDVVAGNVSGKDGARRLVNAGADGIKVGEGPGSICTTRLVTGVGRAQLTAIYESVCGARDADVPVCADGGARFSGDAVKAMAAGAGSIMAGSLLAGTTEAPGRILVVGKKRMKSYDGMGSRSVIRETERYAHGTPAEKQRARAPEGVEAWVPFKGSVVSILEEYRGGVESGMAALGAHTVKELNRNAVFERVTPAGALESRPHDVVVIEEASASISEE